MVTTSTEDQRDPLTELTTATVLATGEVAGCGAAATAPADGLTHGAGEKPRGQRGTGKVDDAVLDESGEAVEVPDGLTIIDHDSGELVAVADLTPASRAGLASVPGWFGTDPPWFCGEPGWGPVTVMAPTNGGTAVSGCAIPGVGWVEAATVASICSTFPLSVGRALLDTTTGTLLETTTTAYKPTKAIREHVTLRDGTCRMWGCTAPANALDLDHTRPWPAGATTPSNLAGLCRRHHRMKQHARWRYTLTPDGTITWISPTGTTRVTHPEHTHWPPPKPATNAARPADQYPATPPF